MIINQQPPSVGGGGGTYVLGINESGITSDVYEWDTDTWYILRSDRPLMVPEGTHILIRAGLTNQPVYPVTLVCTVTGNKPTNTLYYYALVMPAHDVYLDKQSGNAGGGVPR